MSDDQAKFDRLLHRAGELLGAAGRLVIFDWRMDRVMREAAVFESRRGLVGPHAVEVFNESRRGHNTYTGLERWKIQVDGRWIPVVRVHDGFAQVQCDTSLDVWIVPVSEYNALYRYLRTQCRTGDEEAPPPIMREDEQARLWDNSLGFLLRGDEVLKKYGVPQKRGLLLTGEPGNGKTMACRWLYAQSLRRRINWRSITADQYETARAHGSTSCLFQIAPPGIILFDDLDLGMRDRSDTGTSRDNSILLAELDGVQQHEGVVFLFTTNMKVADLDAAFIRRGRIDQVIHFTKPDADLRRRMIREFWHADITSAIDVEAAVLKTAGRSFADLAEIKKLLVLRYADTGVWDFDSAWRAFELNDTPERVRPRIGFAARHQLSDEDFADQDPMLDPMRAFE